MRRLVPTTALAVLLIVAAQVANAQQPQVSATQKAVFALEEEWTRALVNVDTAAFKRITAPGLVYTEDNAVMNQRELINAVVNGDKIEWAGNEEMKLYDYHPVTVRRAQGRWRRVCRMGDGILVDRPARFSNRSTRGDPKECRRGVAESPMIRYGC